MKKALLLLLFFIPIIGCNAELSENGEIAKSYMEELGYKVVSFEGEESIKFTKSDLLTTPNQQIWGVQNIEPDQYVNKDIDTVSFVVKNHPLDDMYNKGKTNVTVYLVNNKVIGGWSFPQSKQPLAGGFYSIDGKTIEDIHGDFQKWEKDWENKYKN